MTVKLSCICAEEHEKPNLYRHLINKHALKTGTKTKCNKGKKTCNIEEKIHECQLNLDNKIKFDDCNIYINENISEIQKNLIFKFIFITRQKLINFISVTFRNYRLQNKMKYMS